MKKFLCGALCFLLCSTLGGCLRRTEIADTAIIQAVGIDIENDEYIVTLQKFSSGGSGGQTPVDIGKNNRIILQERGKSISEALEKIGLQTGRELFLSANHVIVIGRTTAEQGIQPIISFFNSNHQTKPDTHLLISKTTAADIVTLNLQQGIVPADNINRLLKHNSFNSRIISTSLMDVVSALNNRLTDPYIPIAEILTDVDGNPALKLDGTAIFKGDKKTDSLSPIETVGLIFLNNNVDMLLIDISTPDTGTVSLRLNNSDTRFKVRIENEVPVYTVIVKCEAAINQVVPTSGSSTSISQLPQLEKAANLKIAQLMKNTIQKSVYKQNCDVFKLTKHLKQKQPYYWKTHIEQLDEINSQSRFEFIVECNINRIGKESRYSFTEF